MDKNKLYISLYESQKKAHPEKSKQNIQRETTEIWNKIKNDVKLPFKIAEIIERNSALEISRKGTLMSFWGKVLQDSATSTSKCAKQAEEDMSGTPSASKNVIIFTEPENDLPVEKQTISVAVKDTIFKTRAQDEIKRKLEIINCDLVGLLKRKKVGQLSEEQRKRLKELEQNKDKLEKTLKQKLNDQLRQKKSRDVRKKRLAFLCDGNPELRAALEKKPASGRPRVEYDQPELLKTITDIAIHGSAAQDKRKFDIYRSIKTLDELTQQLNLDGFTISRSGVYLRLLPKQSNTIEGQKHVVTVPVKLIRAQNDLHSHHIDEKFCTATIRHLEELASLLGPNEVCYISQDDKARVPIWLAAANIQSPMLMHMEYKVCLPDHDWVVAAKHKLIPSVYAGIVIAKNGLGKPEAVGYRGPTYIAIRSGKHASSTAYGHGLDFENLMKLPEFNVITKIYNVAKPVLIFNVDGGPDENPRYQKVIEVGIHHFLKLNLDALFIATNAPGRSAFNRVERRMAPLSKELSGVILPHEHFGEHLNNQGKTVDIDLEKKKFEYAGNALAEIWSNLKFDGYETVARYVKPEDSELDSSNINRKDEIWFSNHVQTSQYLTQIVKCNDLKCCSIPRSSYFTVLSSQFLPPPIPLCQASDGLKAPEVRNAVDEFSKFPSLFVTQTILKDKIIKYAHNFKVVPYDFYCPTVQSLLVDRICRNCKKYFASNVMLKKHYTTHKTEKVNEHINLMKKIRPIRVAGQRQQELMAIIGQHEHEDAEWIGAEDLDLENIIIPTIGENLNQMPSYSIDQHFSSSWE